MAPPAHLPTELVHQIAGYSGMRTKSRLLRTNRRFYGIVAPMLYNQDAESKAPRAIFWAAAHGQLESVQRCTNLRPDLVYAHDPFHYDRNGFYRAKESDLRLQNIWGTGGQPTISGSTREFTYNLPSKFKLNGYAGTPLHFAAAGGHDKVVDYLLECGAKLSTPAWHSETVYWADQRNFDKYHLLPLHLAIKNGHASTAELIITRGASLQSIECSWCRGRESCIHPDFNAVHCAALYGSTAVMAMLEKREDFGLLINSAAPDFLTPLHFAAAATSAPIPQGARADQILVKLLKKGAHMELRDCWGCTPLTYAAQFRANHALGILLDTGANIEARRYQGDTPLLVAARMGNMEGVKILLRAGADLTATNICGESAMNLAKGELLDLLKEVTSGNAGRLE